MRKVLSSMRSRTNLEQVDYMKFVELVENSTDFIVMASPTWEVFYINHAGLDLLGLTKEDIEGLEVRDLWDEQSLPTLITEVVPKLIKKQPCRFEARLRSQNGEDKVDVDGNAFAIFNSDPEYIQCFAFSMRDVRNQKQTAQALRDNEVRLKAILDSALDGIVTINEYGRIETVNPAVLQIFEYAEEELIGQNVSMLMPEPYHSEHDQYLRNYRHTGQRKIIGIGREVMGRRKDGDVFPIDLSVSEVILGDRRLFTGLIRDITERQTAEHHRDLLVAELSHRVKNTLGTVDSIAQQTFSLDDERFMVFHERLQALASTHSRLAESSWAGANLREVIVDEISPYRGNDGRFSLNGKDVLMNPKSAISIGMAIHELSTNALKYGSLSVQEGRVDISWEIADDSKELIITWIERGGPPVEPPSRSGFGRLLLERGLAHELNGRVALDFDPSGLRCRIIVPLPDWLYNLNVRNP